MAKIAVIGAGWYGCHIARVLQMAGNEVTLLESSDDILRGISGNFGVRLHVGPHYPRSEKTRKGCRSGYEKFLMAYPDLVVEHAYSIYALGERDANNEPSKVDLETFREVAQENKNSREIDPKKWGYSELLGAFDIKEPSILVGNLLREKWRKYLSIAGVKVIRNFKVQELRREGDKILVIGSSCCGIFDYAVNTTSFQSLLPPAKPPLPFKLDVVYQPCLALVYEDRLSIVMSQPPFSFIVMDGWFPCIMPYIENREAAVSAFRKYIVTHGKFTIMGSFKKVQEAKACLEKIDEKFVTTHVQKKCEAEMERFWPLFGALLPSKMLQRRFRYIGWKGAVLAKIKTNREFRSAVTFARGGVVYVIPGKVSNIFDAAHETISLINGQNVLQQGAYQYVRGGTLDDAVNEITETVDPKRNTCILHTFDEITRCGIWTEGKAVLAEQKRLATSESKKSSSLKSEPHVQWIMSNNVDHTPNLKAVESVSFFPPPSRAPKKEPENIAKLSIVGTPQIRSSL